MSHRRRFHGLSVLAALAVLLVGSSGGMAQLSPKMPRKPVEEKPHGPSGPIEQQFPFGSTWVLADVDGKTTQGDAPSFRLDENLRAVGFGGCNTFSMALYPIKEQKLAAGSIATTKKTCGKALDDAERAFLIGLHSLPTWHLEPTGDLSVKLQTGVMHFHRGL